MYRRPIASCLGPVLLIAGTLHAAWAAPQFDERKDLEINVRLATGAQIPARVEVLAYSAGLSVQLRGFTDPNGQVTFNRVQPGNYTIEIDTSGYERVHEEVSVDPTIPVTKVYINLRPLGVKPAAEAAEGPPVLPSNARKDVEKAQLALRAKNYAEAEKYVVRALRAAPNHPLVNYLAGLVYYHQDKLELAQIHVEKATFFNTTHAPSFALLGTVLYRRAKYAGAVAALERALVLDPTPWESHWMIANAYFQEQHYEKARAHAERARQISLGQAPEISLVLGASLANLGETSQAITELEIYLGAGREGPGAEQARQMLSRLRADTAEQSASPGEAASEMLAPAAEAPVPSGLSESWAPPDVDSSKPPVDPNVTCSLSDVLNRTAGNTAALLRNLEKVGAKEVIELYELDDSGNTERHRLGNFDYVIWIREAKKQRRFFIEESRRAFSVSEPTVSRYYTQGIPALALVFHPYYVDDFQITCEGLGQWRGEAAWVVHFRQLDQKPSRLHGYQIRDNFFPVALKGRAWIAANSYQVLRIETALVKPLEDIALQREHMSIEYRPVHFLKEKLELWLPGSAEVHLMRRKQRLRMRHTFTDFLLFLVEIRQEIKAPKEPQEVPPF